MTLCSWWFVGISALVGFVQTGVLRRSLKFAMLFLFVGKLDLKDTGFGRHFDFFSDFFSTTPPPSSVPPLTFLGTVWVGFQVFGGKKSQKVTSVGISVFRIRPRNFNFVGHDNPS